MARPAAPAQGYPRLRIESITGLRYMGKDTGEKLRRFPAGLFVGAVATVCLALAVSAGYSYVTLTHLRAEYLLNRAHEIASAIESQARGPGRRNNIAFWQSLFDEVYPDYADSIRLVALTDDAGRVLAIKGIVGDQLPASPTGFAKVDGRSVYVVDITLMPMGRQGMSPMAHLAAGWHLRVGLDAVGSDFIRRQAVAQVLIAAAAIAALVALAWFVLATLKRFLELKAREDSERRLRALGTMAATLAHEIRNPLGAMKGLTQLSQEDLPSDHRAQESLKTVVSEAERLERLVTDLLLFARPPKPQISRFDLPELVGSLGGMLQSKFEAAGIDLKFGTSVRPLVIESDENGLRQVLLNVFLNAVEAAPHGSVIGVSAAARDGSRDLVLEIDDSGPGIGARDPEELFQPFYTTKVQGTGLGLAISRQIVESLGGTLVLANRPGGGTRCTLRLPDCVVESPGRGTGDI